MNAVDDAKLLQLAQEPDAELVPNGRRVAGLKPLIVLLAFVPSLVAFRHFSPGDVASADGLRALRLVSGSGQGTAESTIRDAHLDDSRITPLDGFMALCLRLELLPPESRLLLVSYFSSVALLLSLSLLIGQTLGFRVELIAVLLAAFHPEILGMGDHLPTTTMAVALALLASFGVARHQASKRWISVSLVGGGVAWGLSHLISESLITATGCLLVVQCAMVRRNTVSSGQPLCWGIWSLRTLLCLLTVTLMMSLTIVAWDAVLLTPLGRSSDWRLHWRMILHQFSTLTWPRDVTFGEICRETLQSCGPLLGFTLLGLVDAGRFSVRRERPIMATDGAYLALWWCVSSLMFLLTWSQHRGEFGVAIGQPLFWLISNLVLAARGVDAVIQRRFGLEVVLWVAGLGVVGAFVSPNWIHVWGLSHGAWWLVIVGGSLVIAAVSWWLHRTRWPAGIRRGSLLGCLSVTLISEIAWGLSSLPPPVNDERELAALRRQIGLEQKPQEAILICDNDPPLRLLFFVQGLCPDTPVRVVSEWETVRADPEPANSPLPLIVTWGSQRNLPVESRKDGRRLVPVSAPYYFQGRTLRAFRWTWRSVSQRLNQPARSETGLAGGVPSRPQAE